MNNLNNKIRDNMKKEDKKKEKENNKEQPNLKSRKITFNKAILSYFILFAIGIFLMQFLIQIVFLKPIYKNLREKQIRSFANEIELDLKKDNNLNNVQLKEKIDYIAYNNQVQIYIYSDDLDLKYTSEDSFGKIPQSISREIKTIMNKFKTNIKINIDNNEYNENVNLKRFNSLVNIFIKRIDSNTNIVIISPIDQIDSTIEVLILQNQYMSIVAIIVAIFISVILSRRITKPIENITRESKLLEKGKYDLEIEETKYYETENLANVLKTSASKLKEKDKFQKNIIANVSHDLKTPLSIIKAYTEKIRDISGDDKKKREEDLNIIEKETDNLSLLISDMLDLSKLDTGDYVLNKTNFNILDVIKNTIDRFKIISEKKNIKININNEFKEKKEKDELIIYADELKIAQVIYNLIANAIQYSKENSNININIKKEKENLKIEVQDFGKGIDKEDLPYIFEKYYKSKDQSKKEDISSTGLGLSIVKSILERHDFKYGVKSEKGKGTIFWFEVM